VRTAQISDSNPGRSVPVSSITVCSSVGTTPTDSLSEGAKLGLFSILYKIKKERTKISKKPQSHKLY